MTDGKKYVKFVNSNKKHLVTLIFVMRIEWGSHIVYTYMYSQKEHEHAVRYCDTSQYNSVIK